MKAKYPNPTCPKCGGSVLRHAIYTKWHECKNYGCGHRFSALCSPHKHGGTQG